MTALAEIFVVIKPETDRFEPQLRKKLAHVDALSAGTKAGSRFGAFTRTYGGAAAAIREQGRPVHRHRAPCRAERPARLVVTGTVGPRGAESASRRAPDTMGHGSP